MRTWSMEHGARSQEWSELLLGGVSKVESLVYSTLLRRIKCKNLVVVATTASQPERRIPKRKLGPDYVDGLCLCARLHEIPIFCSP